MINSIEETAIERIRFAHDIAMRQTGHKPFICISGGKDSSIVQHLAYKSGINCMFIHFLTSVDAPETVRFVKSQFEKLRSEGLEAKILRPKKTMWQLIEDHGGFPPTAKGRYCCKCLKEQALSFHFPELPKTMSMTGVRWAESTKRSLRGEYERLGDSRKEALILYNDDATERKLMENCKLKSALMCNPIIDWTDETCKEYIARENIEICPLYAEGWKRCSCIGCPLGNRRQRASQWLRWPGMKRAWIAAIERGLKKSHEAGKLLQFHSGQDLLDLMDFMR